MPEASARKVWLGWPGFERVISAWVAPLSISALLTSPARSPAPAPRPVVAHPVKLLLQGSLDGAGEIDALRLLIDSRDVLDRPLAARQLRPFARLQR